MLPKPNTCVGCPLYDGPCGKKTGFSYPDGDGSNGVLIIAEALGENEEREGRPLIGASGYQLFQQLKRVDIDREGFMIHNVVSCRPPDNKLVKTWYEIEAIKSCKPNLDRAVEAAKAAATKNGKTFVIVTLGVTAFRAVMGYDYKHHADLLKKDYYAYPFWSDVYNCWVYNAPHPAYLVRGNTQFWPVVHFVFNRALEVAKNGLKLDEPDYLLDPDPKPLDLWADGYERSLLDDPDNPLSYDIETPYKKKVKDEDEVGKEEAAINDDHTIIRISFSYADKDGVTHTVSVPWDAKYMATIERLFRIAPYVLGWNSDKYDYPRVSRYVKINGIGLDGMVAWHILNTSLKKSLGFVTPFYWQNTLMWKHLADKEPAFYNAKDADAAIRNFSGIRRDLVKNNLWEVYERHWITLSKALKYMSNIGVLQDEVMRNAAEQKMSALMDDIEAKMEEAVPDEARELKILKKRPKDLTGYVELIRDVQEKVCGKCGLVGRWKKHAELCGGETIESPIPTTVWGKPLKFKISKKRMSSYQGVLKHQAIVDRKEKKVTYNADAIEKLIKQYPKDPLYPLILQHRKVLKLLSTYIGIEYERVTVPDDYVLVEGEKEINR